MTTHTALGFGCALATTLALLGCPGPLNEATSSSKGHTGSGSGSGAGSGTGSGGAAAQTGLPCDVATILANNCLACHSNPPTGSAPMPLVTYDDLAAASPIGGTYADRSVVRMKDAMSPMPPLPNSAVPDADQATFADWVNAGMPMGDCGATSGAGGGVQSPYDTPLVCTSMKTFTVVGEGSSDMYPGRACMSCHKTAASDDGFITYFYAGGTVYPTAHEPNDCAGYNGADGTNVVITDANGKTVTLPIEWDGDFHLMSQTANLIVFPIHAKVVRGTSVRAMSTAVASGDCNTCHTVDGGGTPAAPGRIMAP